MSSSALSSSACRGQERHLPAPSSSPAAVAESRGVNKRASSARLPPPTATNPPSSSPRRSPAVAAAVVVDREREEEDSSSSAPSSSSAASERRPPPPPPSPPPIPSFGSLSTTSSSSSSSSSSYCAPSAALIGMTLYSEPMLAEKISDEEGKKKEEEKGGAGRLFDAALRHLRAGRVGVAAELFELTASEAERRRSVVVDGRFFRSEEQQEEEQQEEEEDSSLVEITATSNLGYCHYLSEKHGDDAARAFERSVDLSRDALERSVRGSLLRHRRRRQGNAAAAAASSSTSTSSADDGGEFEKEDLVALLSDADPAAIGSALRLAEALTNLSRSYCRCSSGKTRRGHRHHRPAVLALREGKALVHVLEEVRARLQLLVLRAPSEEEGRSVEEESDKAAAALALLTDDRRLEVLSDDQVYVDASIASRRGRHGTALRLYRRYLSRCVRCRIHEEEEGGSRTRRREGVALAVRSAAAMHEISRCLLRGATTTTAASTSPSDRRNDRRYKLDQAYLFALRSLTLRERFLRGTGSQTRAHPDAADSLYLLGDVCAERHEYGTSLDLYTRAASLYEDRYGGCHVKTLRALCNAALVRRELNQLDEAVEACREVLGRGLAVVSRSLWREVLAFEEDLRRERTSMSAVMTRTTTTDATAAAAVNDDADDTGDASVSGDKGSLDATSRNGTGMRQSPEAAAAA